MKKPSQEALTHLELILRPKPNNKLRETNYNHLHSILPMKDRAIFSPPPKKGRDLE